MATVRELKATARPKSGKGAARAARRSGRVPGVIYGENKPPLMVTLDHDELRQRIYAGRFLTTIYDLELDGKKQRVIPRDFQLDPVKDVPIHVDFLRIQAGHPGGLALRAAGVFQHLAGAGVGKGARGDD